MYRNFMTFYAVKLSQYFLPYDAIFHNLSKLKKTFPGCNYKRQKQGKY